METGKKKKSIFKKWWFWVLVVIIVMVAANMGNEDEAKSDKTSEKNTTATTAKKTPAKQDVKKETEEKEYKIGDVVKVGDMEYIVESKETTKQVGPSILPTEAKDTFLIINLKVKNNGNEKVTIDSSFFTLLRGDKKYEADSGASLSANQDESGTITDSFFMSELNPDVELSGKVVFDVTEDTANATDLSLEAQTGIWGTEKVKINLNK
ncbi:DUF4352 domain-containing protein [Listeria newyorkensis]|uniref:DUF4352 domain-containing protein n=1 Tax=Listeria newyorkensis TaxID=1497681 RepID=UPI00051D61DA|nr:DUF4352 domain-containing protein [Listeria newyorkensis]KGL45736.1 hypothetical protein EP58_03345 [Listeria newyorkensis]SQC55325.1 Telomeric repeat-binding factor 2 [Listeria newyorkensis]SQC55622.1 Telomeric repeat-binding factor 2 [Listeria newyorkensis]